MSPNFNDPLSATYAEISCHRDDIPTHHGCYVYTPDNYDDYQCIALWQPAPELGAREWTRNGKRILIGVYRDEGRMSQPGYDFFNDYVVFRLLPTFKPVPIALIREILEVAEPEHSRANVTLTDIQTGVMQVKSEIQTYSSSMSYRRHRQQLDELKKPLRQVYDAKGRVIPPDLRFTKTANAALYFNVPMVNQWDPIPATNPYLPVYDFYGFPLNDASRGPFFAHDIIKYDSSNAVGLSRRLNGGSAIYDGIIHDVFGDYVIGARSNNTVVTRKPVQPLLVDHHNTPYKRAIRRG